MRSMIICIKSSFDNTPVQSGLKNKNQSLSRFVVQTLLATIAVLDYHSLGVRSFRKKVLCFDNEQKRCSVTDHVNAYKSSIKKKE